MVSREEIWWAYRALLGREPESQEAYAHHSTHGNFDDLRNALIGSEEGMSSLRKKMNVAIGALPFSYYRPVTIFIHIQKTGGTSLHNWISTAVDSPIMSDAHMAFLPGYSMSELNQLDLISGHITYQEAMAAPRETKRLICCFREPFARLISLYRFYRAHSLVGYSNPLIRLAQINTVEDFFANEEVRSSHEIDNRYVRVLCDGSPLILDLDGSGLAALDLAIARVSQLEAVAITEELQLSASVIARQFGFHSSSVPRRIHVTNELYKQGGFQQASPVVVTDRLQSLVSSLIRLDRNVYEFAKQKLYYHRDDRSEAAPQINSM